MERVVFVLCFSFLALFVPNVSGIVGGKDGTIDEVPYQVVLYTNKSMFGSGFIYSKDVIISTSTVKDRENLTIRAGSSFRLEGGQTVNVKEYKVHPQNYDVAVLFLENPLLFSDQVKPIGLAETTLEEGNKCYISGWGTTSYKGELSNIVQIAEVDLVSDENCKKSFPFKALYNTKKMVCAGVKEGGVDSCTGDSGAPLVCNGSVLGISSWGIGCADKRYPGVYTNIPEVRDWIEEVVNY